MTKRKSNVHHSVALAVKAVVINAATSNLTAQYYGAMTWFSCWLSRGTFLSRRNLASAGANELSRRQNSGLINGSALCWGQQQTALLTSRQQPDGSWRQHAMLIVYHIDRWHQSNFANTHTHRHSILAITALSLCVLCDPRATNFRGLQIFIWYVPLQKRTKLFINKKCHST